MKKFSKLINLRRVLSLLVIGLFMSICTFSQLPTATEVASQMKVGWNLGNTLEAIGGETAWGNPLTTQTLINAVKAAGFNTVRLPIAWDNHATNNVIDAAWIARVKEVVDYCINANLYVIINIHWDNGWLENNVTTSAQASVNAKQQTYWTQIANYFKAYDQRVLFASANEPNVEDATGMSVLLSYHQTFVNAVRATGGNNSSRTLIIQGPSTDIEKTNNLMNTMPTDQIASRMMVEVHYYTPYQYCLMTTDASWGNMFYYWGNGYHSSIEPARNSTWGEESEVERLLGFMKSKFVDKGIPVIIGEYAAIERTNPMDLTLHRASRRYFHKYVVSSAKSKGIITYYWDAGGSGNALFNRSTGAIVDQELVNAIMEGAGGTTTVAVTGVTMSPTTVSISVGGTTQLTATVAPTNATNKTVSWSTGNSSIAMVSTSGLVTGVAAGSATITVTTQDGSKTATCAVTVTSSSCTPTTIVPYIQVNDGSWSQTSSATVASGAKVKFGPQPVSGGSWSWSGLASGTTREVTIYPTTSGTATATYTNASGCKSTQVFTITVSGSTTVAVTGVTMSPTSASVAVGGTTQLTATIAPTNATNKTVSWSTSNASIATVSTAGLVTGVAAGSATITVTTADGGKTATASITVTTSTVAVTGVTVSPTSATLAVNGTQQLTATISPTNATNKNVTWSTSNSTVATVSTGGLVTAKVAGSATITVTTADGGKTATSAITVNASSTGCSSTTNITIPFSYNGAGDYCWFTTTAMAYVNSWNLSLLTINGTDYTNKWSNSLPAALNGGWTIHYVGNYSWSHFEAPQVKTADEEDIAAGEISIYPNPFTEVFNITIPNPETVNMIVILDQMGRQISIIDQASVTEKMEIGQTLTAGMYIVRVYGLNGPQTFSILKTQ